MFSGNARVEIADSTGGLSWNTANGALSVQCWFKLSIPSGSNLTENMTILANRRGGTTNDAHAFLIEFDIYTGNVEFSTKGTGFRRFTLVERPFLDRWYHVAVVRQNEEFFAYVDGRAITVPSGAAVGDTRSTDGVSVGGWNASGSQGNELFGEVQEVSIYQAALSPDFIAQYMFAGQPTNEPSLNLNGYFKFGFSPNFAARLRNFAPPPLATGTETATTNGPVEFEETNHAGEQSAFDARRNGGRDALTPLSGGFAWEQTALARPVPGIAFDFRFGYSSGNSFGGFKLGGTDPYAAGVLGKGWRHTFETRVVPAQAFSPLADTDTLGLMTWSGAIETWDLDYDTGQYRARNKEYSGELVLTSTNCQWTTPERLVYVFRKPDSGSAVMRGRLTAIRDFNGNNVQMLWNEISGVITQVVDSALGRYNFYYQSGLLTNVSFNQWQVNFAYDATNRLVSKSLTNTASLYTAVHTTWQFNYNTNGLLSHIVDTRGITNVIVEYDQYGRQTNQVDALGRATATRYGIPGKRQITRIDPGTNSWIEIYDRKGHLLAQQDPLTNITSYTYDTNGNRISITEPLGWRTSFGYDDRANVVARTNALGEITRWAYHGFFNRATNEVNAAPWTNSYVLDNATGNLVTHYDGLGTLVSYTYRTNGLVETSTDANGRVSRFTYDTNGFLTSRLDPGNYLWTYANNDVGWKTSDANPLGEVSTYSYNLNGHVVLAIDPLFRHFTKTYDPNGNLLAESDGKNQLTTYAYDPANQRTNMVDRTGTNKWTYVYTSRGMLSSSTDPQANVVRQSYDPANRLFAVTDPLGGSVTNLYDANGNLTVLIDKVGQRWTKNYDRLNRAIAEINPQGDTRQTTYDEVGRIKVVTTPNGYPSTHTYDGRGRLTKWTDARGFDWRYAYDGNANITNITDALDGHYVMTYGPRNERLRELNQDSNLWTYVYDEILRIKEQTDPNGTTRALEYDPGGRILAVTFNTGRKNSMVYDPNNNVTVTTRRVGLQATTTQLAYDAMDRVITQTDAHLKTIRYGFDSLSRITSLTYPDNKVLTQNFDPLGRLTNQVDWAGRTMNYAYDKAGRLIRRTYPTGVVQNNTFDIAGRLTGLSYAPSTINSNSINLALSYAYDRNGNKIGGGERGTFQWPLPTMTDETAGYTPAGRLTNRQIQNTSSNQLSNVAYAYDLSGNMTNATGGGQSWCLTYDEDNRTTSIRWDCGMTAKTITNRFDALGRRISKKVDGIETRYVLDLAGSMERILCDTDDAGNITAWYVHGPDLAYKVDATNGLTCYHADAQANVIALTDGRTNLVTQYAYTPYGRSLSGSNSQPSTLNSQPFLFVGSQGVMEESPIPGLYFMRARYYSADAGVFLSTDPVKNIGPGWMAVAYEYAYGNPYSFSDSKGEEPVTIAFAVSMGIAFGVGVVEELATHFVHQAIEDSVEQIGGENTELLAKGALASISVYSVGSKAAKATSPDPWTKAMLAGNLITSAALSGKSIADELRTLRGSSGSSSKTLSSPTAGTTPMARLPSSASQPQPVSFALSGNSSFLSSQAASLAAPKASGTTAATSTKPSGASGGGTTSSGGGSGGGTYTVKAGDTLGNIGSKFGSTATAIGAANGIQNLNLIKPGQKLKIPGKK